MKKRYFNISTAGCEGKIDIFGSIGEVWWDENGGNSASKLADKMEELKKTKCDSYHVRINSLGGDVDAALAIYDMLKGLPNVTTECIGMCASAATVIFMAGKTRQIAKTARFLIHKCSSYAWGNENEIQRTLEEQKSLNEQLAAIYQENGVSAEKVSELMEANDGQGRWIKPSEAVELGFATELSEGGIKSASAYGRNDIISARLPLPDDMDEDVSPTMLNKIKLIISELLTPKTQDTVDKNKIEEVQQMLNAEKATVAQVTAELDELKNQLNDMTAERDDLKAQLEAMTNERDTHQNHAIELQKLLDKSPAAPTAVNGDDNHAHRSEEEEFVKNSPYYAAIRKEIE